MPINVQAHVIDIRQDRPNSTDQFLVDTNVWYWYGYNNAHVKAKPYQIKKYPNYLLYVRQAKGKLHKSALSFSELVHLIENAELEIFQQRSPSNAGVRLKDFRHHYPAERQNVLIEIANTWTQIEQLTEYVSLPAIIDHLKVTEALNKLPQSGLDIFDWVMVESARSAKITQIITDDADFGTLPDVQIFTANNTLLSEAQTQGRLIQR